MARDFFGGGHVDESRGSADDKQETLLRPATRGQHNSCKIWQWVRSTCDSVCAWRAGLELYPGPLSKNECDASGDDSPGPAAADGLPGKSFERSLQSRNAASGRGADSRGDHI